MNAVHSKFNIVIS